MAEYPRRTMIKVGAAMLTSALLPEACAATDVMIPTPRLNQLGFRPGRTKRFVLAGDAIASSPLAFAIETVKGARVFEAQVGAAVNDMTRTTGEHVRIGDFSAFDTPGRYRIRVGAALSPSFEIGDAIYAPLVRDAARAFYLIRANVALDDPVTGIRHAAGHMSEMALLVDGKARDLTGGWYNAGDFGKWTHMAAISASQMMWLYELRPVAARMLTLTVPPMFPGMPDLLQQARWGLEWLLKMQNPDGSVLHKIDSSERYAWGQAPEMDPFPRMAYAASSLDAGNFTGVMVQASRVFASVDSSFAERCQSAANRAWLWLERNPGVVRKDVNYLDTDPRQEIAWATYAMAAGGEPELAKRATASLETVGVSAVSWQTPQLLGAMSLARSASSSRHAASNAIVAAAVAIADRVEADPYGFSAKPDDYYWGSNEAALNAAVLCLFAVELSREHRFGDAAQRLLDYVLGCNTLNLSFVTGHGEHSVRRPYHWTCRVWGSVIPGWASGGANRYPEGVDPLLKAVIDSGAPPARCFVDACEANGSWGSNEGQTSENAALILATGLFGL